MERDKWKKGDTTTFANGTRWMEEIGKLVLLRKGGGGNIRIDFPTKRSGICGIHVCLHLIYEL